MYSANEKKTLGIAERSDATHQRDHYITIPHRDGERRVQVSIETINKFGGSWSLESAMWH